LPKPATITRVKAIKLFPTIAQLLKARDTLGLLRAYFRRHRYRLAGGIGFFAGGRSSAARSIGRDLDES